MAKSKRALLVGINYKGTSSELNGCINDTTNIKAFLLTQGYKEKHITILTDDTEEKPTRANILKYLMELVLSDCKTLCFHYSGHGSYVKDLSGDEIDGRDETLCPIDYPKSGDIVDDEIRGILQCLKPTQHLTCIIDACRSGTSCDLRWNLYERFGGRRLALVADSHYKDLRGQVVMISGTTDDSTSADAFIDGKFQGAMTHAFLECFSKSKTYEKLIQNIRALLKKEKYSQVPCFSSGQHFDLRKSLSI